MARGRFIVIEGLDGAGSTTQAELLRVWFVGRGLPVHLTREPTDGPVGSLLRLILTRERGGTTYTGEPYQLSLSEGLVVQLLFPGLRPDRLVGGLLSNHLSKPRALALLFAADRMQHVSGEILPKLEQGFNVVCDRYYLSSLAYQTATAAVDMEWVWTINSKTAKPDLTVFLDVPPTVCEERMKAQRAQVELYDTLAKLQEVRSRYLVAIEYLRSKGELIEVVDGDRPINTVQGDLAALVSSIVLPFDNPPIL